MRLDGAAAAATNAAAASCRRRPSVVFPLRSREPSQTFSYRMEIVSRRRLSLYFRHLSPCSGEGEVGTEGEEEEEWGE